jgi:phosphatidylinositol alpha-mannosyltransferase
MDKRYSIVFSSYDDLKNPYYGGGGARAVHEVARRLARGHRVTVLTGKYPGARNETVDGVRYERIGGWAARPKLAQLTYPLFLLAALKRKDFDVWIESFTPPFSTACLQLFTSKPVIGLAHMLGGEDMRRKYRLPFHWIERAGLKTYRRCIVLTKEFHDRIRACNAKADIEIIPNGVSRSDVDRDPEAPKSHLLFLGRIEVDQKGLDLLVRSYARVKEAIPYPLVIAGSGAPEEEERLRLLIRENGVEDRIELAGKVDGQRKIGLLQGAACLAVPSRFETFSLAALEAMAFRVPVIAFAIPGLEWMPRSGVVKVEPFDEGALAQAMLSVSREGAPAHEAGNALTEAFWKQYDWDHVAERYEACIGKAIRETA